MPWALMTSRIYAVERSAFATPSSTSRQAHLGLEGRKVLRCERVGLGDDRDEVDPGAETLHDLNVEGLEAVKVEK